MATTRSCVTASRRWECATWSAFARPPRCGRRARAVAAEAAVGRGRRPKRLRRDASIEPVSVKALALGLPKQRWRTIAGAKAPPRRSPRALLDCAFARRTDDDEAQRTAPEEWLLIEWPEGEKEPTKYWLSTLPEDIAFAALGRCCQAALAHRARLSGTQAGGRARTLRRPRMARLPSPRHAVHRSLRIPDLREGDDSPLRTSSRRAVAELAVPAGYRPRGSADCDPSATFQTRSPPCADA